jgi:uncharacterized protein (TIGR00255 family)
MIYSMTSFARSTDQTAWGIVSWEMRVVNYRYFDCALKMPDSFKFLESKIRVALQQQLQRGRVECVLKFNRELQGATNLVLDLNLVKKLIDVIREVKSYLPMANVDPMKILSWPQVLQKVEEDPTPIQELVLNLFNKTLVELIATREREGEALAEVIKNKIQAVATIISHIKAKIPNILKEYRAKIVKKLEEVSSSFDQSRLEQELVYFTQRIDITEELERLEAHGQEVARVLNNGGVVGKRLDFLMQELNREANTLAAKTTDIVVTQAAVELKILIEQMREQIQNLV